MKGPFKEKKISDSEKERKKQESYRIKLKIFPTMKNEEKQIRNKTAKKIRKPT